MKEKSIVIEGKGYYEVRCKTCGKLLFTYKDSCLRVDKTKQNVTIVARCVRCKTDNTVCI